MGDYRAELRALIAAYDKHYGWMLADRFESLRKAAERARAALDEQDSPESWHISRALSDEALRLLTELPMEEIERRLRMDGPAVPKGRELAAVVAEPSDEELDELAWSWYSKTGSTWYQVEAFRAFARAALARWGSHQPLRPIPVSERLPGDQLCWWFEPDEDCGYGSNWTLLRIRGSATGYTHWLPANALPLPLPEDQP